MTMTPTAPARERDRDGLLHRLESVMHQQSVSDMATRLAEMRLWMADDLRSIESDLAAVERFETPLHDSVHHLLSLEGKRLRPVCVALAARAGVGFTPAARSLAVAVELIHSATLLHDDVVDVGDLRRNAPTARVLYGNAASIFAGDWLLVEALRRVRESGIPELSDKVLGVLTEMLHAEGLQLAGRGSLKVDLDGYFRVIEGKTASLFRWAMYAGGRAGELPQPACEALALFGQKLGVAFQVQDDVLDVAGDPALVGKGLFADLREGKLTHPFLLAMTRDPQLVPLVAEASRGADVDPEVAARVTAALRETRAIEDSAHLVRTLCDEAIAHLSVLPPSRAREALAGVAVAMLHRRK